MSVAVTSARAAAGNRKAKTATTSAGVLILGNPNRGLTAPQRWHSPAPRDLRAPWGGRGGAGTLKGMNRLFLLAVAVLAVHVHRRQLRPAPARHVGGRSSRQRPRAARRARASPRGRTRACAAARRGALALMLGVFGLAASGEAVHYGRAATTTPGFAAIPAALVLFGVGAVTLWRSRRRDALAATCAAPRSASPACSSSSSACCPSAWPTSRCTSARDVVPAPHLGAAHENVTLTTSDGLKLQGLVRPVAQRRRRDRLPRPQGPAAARADARPPRLRRAAPRPPRRGRERGRADLWGWGGARDLQGRRRVPAAPPRRRARPHRRARAVGRRRVDDRGRRLHSGR